MLHHNLRIARPREYSQPISLVFLVGALLINERFLNSFKGDVSEYKNVKIWMGGDRHLICRTKENGWTD